MGVFKEEKEETVREEEKEKPHTSPCRYLTCIIHLYAIPIVKKVHY